MRLELAYAWVTHSNDQISPEQQEKIKSLVLTEDWDRNSYHLLASTVVLMDITDAKKLVDSAYKHYEKDPAIDTFTLQFVALIAVNYLNCCYHQHGGMQYAKSSIDFLDQLVPEPAIGLNKLLGKYYQAVFSHDHAMQKNLVQIIKDIGYLPIISDTLE